jgi:hypothetical protein
MQLHIPEIVTGIIIYNVSRNAGMWKYRTIRANVHNAQLYNKFYGVYAKHYSRTSALPHKNGLNQILSAYFQFSISPEV